MAPRKRFQRALARQSGTLRAPEAERLRGVLFYRHAPFLATDEGCSELRVEGLHTGPDQERLLEIVEVHVAWVEDEVLLVPASCHVGAGLIGVALREVHRQLQWPHVRWAHVLKQSSDWYLPPRNDGSAAEVEPCSTPWIRHVT